MSVGFAWGKISDRVQKDALIQAVGNVKFENDPHYFLTPNKNEISAGILSNSESGIHRERVEVIYRPNDTNAV